ncbi:MAG: stage II sporulation protein R [Clostridia bacterium]
MKKVIFLMLLLIVSIFLLSACDIGEKQPDCIRIHIRANSNVQYDQDVKYLVRDYIVEALTPILAECKSKDEAYKTIKASIPLLTDVANACLVENEQPYTAKISLRREKFPTRQYLSYTFPGGIYDALIIELGEGVGDNWWCVAFPPLCFVPTDGNNENFKYKSKILEIIEKYKEVKDEQ